jgi:hypothetical protein
VINLINASTDFSREICRAQSRRDELKNLTGYLAIIFHDSSLVG